jgi:uncharacterized protein (TIRG00374 family)
VVLTITQRGLITSSLATFDHLHWIWLPLAVELESASIATFARMQRRLFRAGDQRAPLWSVMATTYAGNAISVSVPLAGPQLGTAFAFRRFRRLGIDSTLAGWALVVSGVVSSLTAGLILVVGALLSGNDAVAATGAIGGVTGATALAVATVALRWPRLQRSLERWLVWVLRQAQRVIHRPDGNPAEAVRRSVAGVRSLNLGWSEWARVLGLAFVNWLADAAVLVVSIVAVGGTVPWQGLLFAYGVRVAAGGISITPGGLGVVEGALTLTLVSVGLRRPSALAAVLLYRFISFWIVTAVGWLVYMLGRSGGWSARPCLLRWRCRGV